MRLHEEAAAPFADDARGAEQGGINNPVMFAKLENGAGNSHRGHSAIIFKVDFLLSDPPQLLRYILSIRHSC